MTQTAGRRECTLPPPQVHFPLSFPAAAALCARNRGGAPGTVRPLAAARGVSGGGPEPWTRCWSFS